VELSGIDEQKGERFFQRACSNCGIITVVTIISPGYAQIAGRMYCDKNHIVTSTWSFRPTYESIMNYRVRCGNCNNEIIDKNVVSGLLMMYRENNTRMQGLKRELDKSVGSG
jgi:ribosomal protein S27E